MALHIHTYADKWSNVERRRGRQIATDDLFNNMINTEING